MSFATTWDKILANAGEEFRTKRNWPFTYKANEQYVLTSRTKFNLSKSDFEKAHKLMPLDGPGQINKLVRGPAYIFAILNDRRIGI